MKPFTDPKVINKILDLINIDIETTFLEPTCGTGNFLIEILKRKFNLIKDNDNIKCLLAISSLYGIDIIDDCVETTKNRLYNIFAEKITDQQARIKCKKILNNNIIQSNILEYNTKLHYNIIIGNPPYWINNESIYEKIIEKLKTFSFDKIILIIPDGEKRKLL